MKENTFIITVFTKNHGLYSGVVREPSKKSKFIYQEGNIVDFLWQARLHEHIGIAKCELIKSYIGNFITNKDKLYAFNSIISLIKVLFQEREEHHNFFITLTNYLDVLAKHFCFRDYINFELAVLAETGYELDLTSCVKAKFKLCIPHKSGRALSYEAGAPYKDKLLLLPKFLLSNDIVKAAPFYYKERGVKQKSDDVSEWGSFDYSEITLEEKKQEITC